EPQARALLRSRTNDSPIQNRESVCNVTTRYHILIWRVPHGRFSRATRLASGLPESQWSAPPPVGQPEEQYTWVKHQPGECAQARKFATVRWKKEGDLMWRYA